MKFTKFIFDNYLQTKEGEEALNFFTDFWQYIIDENVDIIYDFFQKQYLREIDKVQINEFMKHIKENIRTDNQELLDNLEEDKKSIFSIETASSYFDAFIKNSIENSEKMKIREFLTYIESISLILHFIKPEYYFPYFFVDHFFILESIFNEFSIPLPNIPSKVKHEERLYYYFELCKSLFEFRKNHDLSPIELNVFLYYFSRNIIDNIDIRENNFPEPSKVYISGATKYDCTETIEKSNKETKTLWAGNVNTLPGDIILIYGVAPFSQINSIWRAVSKGFLDPFSYWHNLIWVGNPIKIPSIPYQELVENKIWGIKSIVKSHMQGISGVQCTVEEYNEIIKILKLKGFNSKELPRIKGPQLFIKAELNIERDVEIHLLEPFLNRLGFSEKDWVKQMPLRMGRGERIYPDYAIKAINKRGEETAEFIWEAKLRISNQKQLLEDFFQAKSYALRLNAKGLGLVAIEGIWLSYKKDSFMFEKIIKYAWEEINNSDTFNKILLEIGNKG
ncbi:MAG: hypothetical protein LBI14_08290 [Treponema sp.]|jgi:hypothetical protein|nr:hypothetical protein [Treponema sp.]